MQRKKFISSTLLGLTALTVSAKGFTNNEDEDSTIKIPIYLKKGDTIGISSVAGFISIDECKEAIDTIHNWGFNTQIGLALGKKFFVFGGTDDERIADFQELLDNENINAIMCARGGYGLVRIIDRLNFTKFIKKPKWIIGFSDVTVLHSHINKNFSIATIHSKMCNSFVPTATAEPIQLDTLDSIRQCLIGQKMIYNTTPNSNNKIGNAKGILVGGNLKTLESLSASKSDINTKNKILFVEDTGEKLYSIDRMFWNLKRSGKLTNLAALIVGGFKIKKDEEGDEFGKTIEEIVLEKITEYNYPVCFDFAVGHQKNNFALKCGIMHKLIISENDCKLIEN
ncbi:MAG: LD-carboxypeptidase [Ferruginibacter sp.]|nr:LD-carboxypeptidase [Ferruginibacter sp.]